MEKPKSTFEEDSMDHEIVAELITKLNELYTEAQSSQEEDNLPPVKSNVVAEPLRVNGDRHFATGSFDQARRFYTQFLACAEEDNEAIGTVYANRSAVLFKLGYFEQSLLDIDRALNSNYPEDKKKSLHERKEQASIKAKPYPPLASSRTSEVEAEWRDKLRHFHNPHIPGASKKIKLESNENWGRHLVATENINAGEILTSQKFFAMVNAQGMKAKHANIQHQVCSYCLLYNPALIPCPTCYLAMYCSEHCRTEAFNSYHRIECRVFRTENIFVSKYVRENIVALRCLLVGTGQGAGLASLVKKIELKDIFDVEANIDESSEKPFSNDYTFLVRLCRKLLKPLSDKVDFIPKIVIALRKAGYFDSVSDPLQHEASIDPKADGYNNSKSQRDDECNEKDVNTQECKTETSVSKEAAEQPLNSTSQPPDSCTEISMSPLDYLPASNDGNEQNLVERQGFVLVEETSLFKNLNLYGADVTKPGPTSAATPQQDAYSVDSNANQHQKQYMTSMELFASFLLLNHIQSIDDVSFALRKSDNKYSEAMLYGLGVCILHAALNHSCDPNVDIVTRGQETAMYAVRPISKGEQIFITYVGSFAYRSLQKRKELLSLLLTVNCECVACVNKWPMFNDLIQMRPKFLVSSKKAGIKAIQKITSPLSGKTAYSTSRLEIIQVIGRLCDWLYTNVERPYAISAQCERLLIRAMKDFYDTSSLFELTELRKKKILDCISNIVSSVRIDLQHLVT